MIGKIIFASLLAALPAAALAAKAAPPPTQAGMLNCKVSPGVGLLITSRKALQCDFKSTGSNRHDRYVGSISKLGIDVGATTGGQIVWAVYRAGRPLRPGDLAGDYGGVSAEASVVVGLGANALVGGTNKSVSLQPFSVEGQTGLNIAVGVSELSLERAR